MHGLNQENVKPPSEPNGFSNCCYCWPITTELIHKKLHHDLVTSVLEEREPLFHCSMLIKKQNQLHKQHVPQPNTVLYTSIIDAWSRSSHPMAAIFAEKWLHHMDG
jgi:hypothetical protein